MFPSSDHGLLNPAHATAIFPPQSVALFTFTFAVTGKLSHIFFDVGGNRIATGAFPYCAAKG